MALVTPQHVPVLTSGFVALLVGSILALGVLNYVTNK